MSEQVTKKGGRYYKPSLGENRPPILGLIPLGADLLRMVFPQGGDAPSVTTILSALSKPALVGWAAREERKMVALLAGKIYERLHSITAEPVGAEKFVEILTEEAGKGAHRKLLEKASNVGTEVHARVEWEFKGELGKERAAEPPKLTTEQAERAFMRWTEWRKAVKLKPLQTETRLFSYLFGFGGTLDLLAELEIDGQTLVVVIDFKTGKAVYAESYLQNVAYRLALQEAGQVTHGGFIVRLPKYEEDPDFDAVRVPDDPTLAPTFLALRVVYNWWVESHPKRPSKKAPSEGEA